MINKENYPTIKVYNVNNEKFTIKILNKNIYLFNDKKNIIVDTISKEDAHKFLSCKYELTNSKISAVFYIRNRSYYAVETCSKTLLPLLNSFRVFSKKIIINS